ncbi:MAG: DegT/DnrJ/EryC1/StrS family aminotransferase [Deltaproteobacteria bacterium]|nr:DegT/DnrJ/EryC1/StrS family aminotransferase [Deltaproteobacteria bacterium]
MSLEQPRIPIAAPGRSYQAHKDEINAAITAVLEGGHYILGPQSQRFEESFSKWVGSSYGIALASGTDAISLALRSCGVTRGDGVLTVANTAGATIAAIEAIGAVPILVDIHEATMNICIRSAEAGFLKWKDTYPIRAVVPVHMYGHSANMNDVMSFAEEYDLLVVEDGSQAHGARWNNQMVGSFGHAAAFSFYPTKNLGAYGDAGMLVTKSQSIADQARELRQYGWRKRHISYHQATNSRMDDIQAAILSTRFKSLAKETKRRQEIAQHYTAALKGKAGFRAPDVSEEAEHVFHQYVVRHPNRDALASHLNHAGVDTSVLYPVPIHRQPIWENLPQTNDAGLEVCEKVSRHILSIPVHPFLRDSEIERIVSALESFSDT